MGWIHSPARPGLVLLGELGGGGPGRDEVNGCLGLHQTSVETSAALPMASMNDGNSRALPTEAILGR